MDETLETVFSCSGETAVITGGGTGIGYAMASCLVRAGARVALVGRREEVLVEAAEKLGQGTVYRVYDVTDTDGADSLIESIEKEIGPVSILVNNAGHVWKGPAEKTPSFEFENLFDTHVSGPFALCRAVIPGMKKRGKGHLLFTASMASLFGLPGVVGYAAAKSALLGVVRSLAVELSPDGIRVNAVAPGWITSELLLKTVEADPERKRKVLSRTPMGRFGTAEEVGWAAVYLSSPAASFVTGVCFPVDGGISIGF
jgi:NAD(P)-dependent dehydrogenase (short-subunit alcohol dehydrogenase family)